MCCAGGENCGFNTISHDSTRQFQGKLGLNHFDSVNLMENKDLNSQRTR